jgi:hypothetical protein
VVRHRCRKGIARERRVNRYYDPTTDQFLSVDPDVAETGQPYAFTGDDPLNASDPLGLDKVCEGDCESLSEQLIGTAAQTERENTAAQVAGWDSETGCDGVVLQAATAPTREAGGYCQSSSGSVGTALRDEGLFELAAAVAAGGDEYLTALFKLFGSKGATGRPPVVVGERMEVRVQPFADRIGGETYNPDPTAPEEEWEQNQLDWITKQMDDGRTILDCGPAPGNANYPEITSPWYNIEKNAIAARSYPVTMVNCD